MSLDDHKESTTVSVDLLLGKTIAGRYHLERLIAKGGMGRVYLATQHPLQRKVAVKVLAQRGDIASDPNFVRRFFLEAAVCARLAHPNIVTMHDYGEGSDGQLFMAMEYLDGDPLSAEIKRGGALDEERAASITLFIARALREAHAHGIIHRDLKPGNIMLLRGKDDEAVDAVKVLDFGLVKVFQTEDSFPADLADLDLTRAGMLLGSPRYMSPEQVRNEALDPRTDIYSLGIILYQMLAGRTPFNGRTSVDIMHAHLHDPPAKLNHVSAEMWSLVKCMLEKDRDFRPPTAQELIKKLKGLTALPTRGNSGATMLHTPAPLAAAELPAPEPLAVAELPVAALAEPIPEPSSSLPAQPTSEPPAAIVEDEASNTQHLREHEVSPRSSSLSTWLAAVIVVLLLAIVTLIAWPTDPKISQPDFDPEPVRKAVIELVKETVPEPALVQPVMPEEPAPEAAQVKKRPVLRPKNEVPAEGVPDIRLQR